MFGRKISKADRERLLACIAVLEKRLQVDSPMEYPEEADYVLGMLPADTDYLAHKEALDEKGTTIEEMSLKELSTMLTFYQRGERFCYGFIAGTVNSGELLRVAKRLDELTRPHGRR